MRNNDANCKASEIMEMAAIRQFCDKLRAGTAEGAIRSGMGRGEWQGEVVKEAYYDM